MKPVYIAGIDEAGRGPVLGPMVIAGVVIGEVKLQKLVELGLTDSKKLTEKKRKMLYEKITAVAVDYQIICIPAEEIDQKKSEGINLNKLEVQTFMEILTKLTLWSKAFVDACDTKPKRLQMQLEAKVGKKIVAEHSADLTYPIVSAASVLAKETREREMDKAAKQYDLRIGSGYPSDPVTINFLKEYITLHKRLPAIARKTWGTSKNLMKELGQTKLENFFKNP